MFSKEYGTKSIITSVIFINFAALFFLFSSAKKSKEVAPATGGWTEEGARTAERTSAQVDVVAMEGIPQDEVDLVLQKFRKLQAVQSVETEEGGMREKRGGDSGSSLAKQPLSSRISPRQYVVLSGDTLESIARQFQVPVQDLAQYNSLQTEVVELGQVILIPDKQQQVVRKEPQAESQEGEPVYYVVKAGDSPWVIASKHHIPLHKLLKLNDLDEAKSRRLKPGDKVRIR